MNSLWSSQSPEEAGAEEHGESEEGGCVTVVVAEVPKAEDGDEAKQAVELDSDKVGGEVRKVDLDARLARSGS